MKTFVLLSKMAPQNASLIEVGAKLRDRSTSGNLWLQHIKDQCPEIQFKAHYALIGYWDFMDIYEAPDDRIAAKVSLLTRASGASQVESWLAIPYEQIVALAEEIKAPRPPVPPERQ